MLAVTLAIVIPEVGGPALTRSLSNLWELRAR